MPKRRVAEYALVPRASRSDLAASNGSLSSDGTSGSLSSPRKVLQRIGELAIQKQTLSGCLTVLPKQADMAYTWKCAAIHPMQVLQNIQHRVVREAMRAVQSDEQKKNISRAELEKYFYFDAATPQLLPSTPRVQKFFLEERAAECGKRLLKLNRVARKLETFDDPRDAPGQLSKKLNQELIRLAEIVADLPDPPASIQSLLDEILALTSLVASVHRPTSKDLSVLISRAEKLATRLENLLAGFCCIANLYVIDTFYLWRLLVKYRFLTETVLPTDLQSALSGEVTGLLHAMANARSNFLHKWLTKKLVELNQVLMRRDKENLFFYLKGGRALYYMMGTPDQGSNDFDTGIIINPNLPPRRWYELFSQVHNDCLLHLRACKYEFIKLMEDHVGEFGHGPVDGGEDESNFASSAEDEDDKLIHLMTQLDSDSQLDPDPNRHNSKAELIDIGMPHRDSWEIWETWGLKADAIKADDGMVYPGPLYYVNEYVMLIRESLIPGSSAVKKTKKRLERLSALLATDKTNAAIDAQVLGIPPEMAKAVSRARHFENGSKVILCVLRQLVDAHRLKVDQGFGREVNEAFEKRFKSGSNIQYPPGLDFSKQVKPSDKTEEEFQRAERKKEHEKETFDACWFMNALAKTVEKHLVARGEFFRRNRKGIGRAIRDVCNSSDLFRNQEEDLEIQLAITGCFAARLHGEYSEYEHMEEIEPLHRFDLKIFCRQGTDRSTLFELINPVLDKLCVGDSGTPRFVRQDGEGGEVNLFWPREELIGKFRYAPLAIRLTVEEREEGEMPELAFLWGFRVLGIRDLVWDYLKLSGHTEEFASRRRLNRTINALTDILTDFESPRGELPPPAAERSEDHVNGLVRITQAKPNWCWAATSAMIRNFFGVDMLTQQQIVRGLYQNEDDQQGPLLLPGLSHNGSSAVALPWDDVKEEINGDRPFIFASGTHYMIATGFVEEGFTRDLLYWDPLGRNSRMSYAAYRNMVGAGGATYYGFRVKP